MVNLKAVKATLMIRKTDGKLRKPTTEELKDFEFDMKYWGYVLVPIKDKKL
jgi:hypothetical protein